MTSCKRLDEKIHVLTGTETQVFVKVHPIHRTPRSMENKHKAITEYRGGVASTLLLVRDGSGPIPH